MDLRLTPSSSLSFLFSCRMEKDHEEVSTSKAGRRRGTPREMPTASNLIAAMPTEELRLYIQISTEIGMETSNGETTTTVGEANNVVYFTQEHFVAELHLPISSLMKWFLHFTQAPPVLIHPNVFRILMGCSILNSLYQLDVSLVEICFISTLKLGIGGLFSMSVHSPRLQFVTKLPNSPKTEAKGVVLVKGMWYETPGSPRLPFGLNQSLPFPGLSIF